VACAAGIADLVTTDRSAIFECKLLLHRRALLQACSQAQIYRQAINPEARAIVVGFTTPEVDPLRAPLASLGVEIMSMGVWPHVKGRERGDTAHAPLPPHLSTPSPATLGWNVARLALDQGIPNPARLGLRIGVRRQRLYPIWQGTNDQISLELLGHLARGLRADPGEWFAWAGEPFTSALRWNVGSAAETRNLTPIQLSFKAAVHMSSITPIWEGTAQAVAPATLARIAIALDSPHLPFSIGHLFGWDG
jgi:DNA-binding Xre family transcriptional regulator